VTSTPGINTLPSPRILKTHLPYKVVPKSVNEDNKCKYIYVARNPKDVAVSYYKFATSLERYCGPWEFYVKLFVEGNVKFIYTFSLQIEEKITVRRKEKELF